MRFTLQITHPVRITARKNFQKNVTWGYAITLRRTDIEESQNDVIVWCNLTFKLKCKDIIIIGTPRRTNERTCSRMVDRAEM